MVQIKADESKTAFQTADEIVSHVTGGADILAICPGKVVVDPAPSKASSSGVGQQIIFWLLFLVGGAVLGYLYFEVTGTDIDPKLIFLLFLVPVFFIFLFKGNRLRQDAIIISENTLWVLTGVVYNVKTKSFYYNIVYSSPRSEVRRVREAGKLRTMQLQLSAVYTISLQQPLLDKKDKYYTQKIIDINEAKKIFV